MSDPLASPDFMTVWRSLERCIPRALSVPEMADLTNMTRGLIDDYQILRARPKLRPPSAHRERLNAVAKAATTIIDHLESCADVQALVVDLDATDLLRQLANFDRRPGVISALERIKQNAATLADDESELAFWRELTGAPRTPGESPESEFIWRPAAQLWVRNIRGDWPGKSENGPFVYFVETLHELAGAPVLSGSALAKALRERILPGLENRPAQELGKNYDR